MTVALPGALRIRIHKQLQGTYPNEGGGFLLGHVGNSRVSVVDITPVENIFEESEQYHRYAMTPQDWIRLEDEADERGLTLIGYYHSHPDSPAVPSEYDRQHALPNFLYIIVSVEHAAAVDTRAWTLSEDRRCFNELSFQAG
jgi:proteasome lid subunit RPN8/RPN11